MEKNSDVGSNKNKVERKVMEKNRRNHMKFLISKLNSLLPTTHHTSNLDLPLSVSDQIEEAINYIKSLEVKLKNDKEKRDNFILMGTSTPPFPTRTTTQDYNDNSPELKIKEMGSAVEVVLTTTLEDRFLFYEIIRIFHEERVEIINVTYSVLDNTIFYSLHAEIEDVVYEFGAMKLTERLKNLVYEWKGAAEVMQAAAVASSSGQPPTNSSDHH